MTDRKTSREQRRLNLQRVLFATLCLIVIASMVFMAVGRF